MDNKNCKNCKWFKEIIEDDRNKMIGNQCNVIVEGRCHKNPPNGRVFPLVDGDDFCGGYTHPTK